MKQLQAQYENVTRHARELLHSSGIAEVDLVQADMICYDVPTLERYEEVKIELAQRALLLSEAAVNGRLISVFELQDPLTDGDWTTSYLELPQPKSGDEVEGIDHIQLVTRQSLSRFQERYGDLDFQQKGTEVNRLLQFEDGGVKVRFHDKHIGAVIELEQEAEGEKQG